MTPVLRHRVSLSLSLLIHLTLPYQDPLFLFLSPFSFSIRLIDTLNHSTNEGGSRQFDCGDDIKGEIEREFEWRERVDQ